MAVTENKHKLTNVQKGIICGLAAAITFAAYILINRYVYLRYDVDPFRYTVTFMLVGAVFAGIGLTYTRLKSKVRIIKRSTLPVVGVSILAGFGIGVFIYGQRYTTAVNAGILATLTIVTTAIYARIILKESLYKRQLLWVGVMFVGLYLAIVGFQTIQFGLGEVLVIFSCLILGLTNVLSKSLMQRHASNFIGDVRLVTGGLLFLILGLVVAGGSLLVVSAGFWPIAAGFCFWVTIRLFYESVRYISPTRSIVLANSHPIFTPLAGVLLLGEPYHPVKFLGAVIILTSIYFFNKK